MTDKTTAMLTVYAFATPNSVKVPIACAELGLPYDLRAVNIRKGAQRAPDYLALNPNGKVPLLVDGDMVLPESGAILVHLAEKAGRLLPTDPRPHLRMAVCATVGHRPGLWPVGVLATAGP